MNQHHRDKHLPVKCDMCTKYFSCPNEMVKHKYKHYEVMFECAICEKGFTFESQYVAHKMKHHKSPGHQCIKCQKWFMRSSELNAHLITHGKKYTYCTEPCCDYKTRILGMCVHKQGDIVMCQASSARNVTKFLDGVRNAKDTWIIIVNN